MQDFKYCVWIICVLHSSFYIYEYKTTKLNGEEFAPGRRMYAEQHDYKLTDVTQVAVLPTQLFCPMKVDVTNVENVTS